MSRTARIMNLLHRKGVAGFAQQLKAFYGEENFVKLNAVKGNGDLPNLLTSGGADDTLLSPPVVKIDGEWWLDDGAYAEIGLPTYDANGLTSIITVAPNAVDLSTVEAYLGELRNTNSDRNFVRFTTTANQLIWNYFGDGVGNGVAIAGDWVANKRYILHHTVGSATDPITLSRDGLLMAVSTVTNDWTTTAIATTYNVYGAARTIGTLPINGKKGVWNMYDGILTTAEIRADAKQYFAGTRFGHTNLYGVKGDGTSAYLTVNDDVSIDDHFDGGGVLAFEGVAHSYTSLDRILNKRTSTGWTVYQSGVSGNLFGIAFLIDFSVSDGAWITDPIIELDKPFIYIVEYDASSDANDPTVTIIQNGTTTTLTVGSGLTEGSTPSGTRVGDGSKDMGILAVQVGANQADATAHQAALLPSGATITALGQDWSDHNPAGYWKMCDYVDSSGNVDNIDTGGTGTIYDASSNSNDATPQNMDNGNMEFLPSRYLETYRQAVVDLLDPDFYFVGRAGGFDDHVGSDVNLGTNTANGAYTYLGERLIDFDGSTSYVDLSSVITGTAPTTWSFSIRVQMDDITPTANEYLLSVVTSTGDTIVLYIDTSGVLTLTHTEDSNATTLTHDVSLDKGIHSYGFRIDGTALSLDVDGVEEDTDTAGASVTGNLSTVLIGALNTTPDNSLAGVVSDILFSTDAAYTDAQVLQAYNLLPEIK